MLHSKTWEKAGDLLRKSRLSTISAASKDDANWDEAFALTVLSIKEEREIDPDFAPEISMLDEATDYKYSLSDCLEAYFNHMEAQEKWEVVIASCNCLLDLFKWENEKPSEYMFRKGNALEALKRYDEAEAFGKKWLEQYPDDIYAGASNAFLLASLGRMDEAKAITEKFLAKELQCEDGADTLFMAAYRLYELTDDIDAKQRVEKKMAEYNKLHA